ncbi:MAG: hypothetical protein K1W28_03570 [Lachnospiraceae bacterium]
MWNWRCCGALVLSGLLLSGSALTVWAEEVTPPGYHIYDVQETEVSDAWYAISRSDYLLAGITKLTQGDKGYALCSGYTMAQFECDRVYLGIYLDQSDDGENGWHTIDYWTTEVENASVATTESGPYKITRDKYYSVTGVHSVTEDGFTETTMTCTDALFFD